MVLFLKMMFAYLLGSIPSGVWLTKLWVNWQNHQTGTQHCNDIHQLGSGNTGATNVYRSVHPLAGLVTFFLDVLKSYLAAGLFSADGDLKLILGGLPALLGHRFSCFDRFRGGKLVASSLGLAFAFDPKVGVFGLTVWLVVLLMTQYVSLASIVAIACVPCFIGYHLSQYGLLALLVATLLALAVPFLHKANIQRLLAGKERKVSIHAKIASWVNSTRKLLSKQLE